MNSPYSQAHRVTPTGIATASILLVTLCMAASLLFEQLAAKPSDGTTVVQAAARARADRGGPIPGTDTSQVQRHESIILARTAGRENDVVDRHATHFDPVLRDHHGPNWIGPTSPLVRRTVLAINQIRAR